MHHNHHFWWRFFPKKELTQIYISAAIRSFALSLIAIFVPLYLYVERGYSMEQTLYFFIFYSIIFAVTTPLAAKFVAKFGTKHSVLLSVPFYLAFILSLYSLPYYPIPLTVVSGFLGLSLSFYWMGMHLAFYHASDHDHRGEEIGKRMGVSILATAVGPLFGGFLISTSGFGVVFILVAGLLIFSSLILFLSKENHYKFNFSIRSLVNRRHWQNSLFFVSRGTRGIAGGVIWPLFIFSILGNYFSLGVIGTTMAGLSAVLIWMTGKFSDRVDKRKIIRWLVIPEALSWVLRALVVTTTHVFGATIFGAVVYGIWESPIGALEYDKAKRNIAEYFVTREIFICLGRVLLLTFVLMADSLSGGLIFHSIISLAAFLF
jgi:MFS family permease